MFKSKWNDYDDKLKLVLQENLRLIDNKEWKSIATSVIKDLDKDQRKAYSTYIRRNYKSILDLHEGVYSATDSLDVANSNVKHMWIKDKHTSLFVKNPNFVEAEAEPEKEIDFLAIFKDKIKPITLNYDKDFKALALFDRLVFTDVHIGMNVNPDGYSLYGGLWDETELNKRLEIMVNFTLHNRKSKTLIINELGDFMDGWDGFTTRGGHALPQNMDNQTAFDVGLRFKIQLIDALIPYYERIECVNICNDNHSGSFGYIVNSAFKTFIELKYPDNVKVINQRKFIDHYFAENRCFILTHGKDDKSLKFGFKPVLDAGQIEKIKNYIDENKLHGYKIEFGKGDSHQYIFDNSTSKHFNYHNFPAFSPPSNWVQTNFQNSISGFVHFNYYENTKTLNDYIF